MTASDVEDFQKTVILGSVWILRIKLKKIVVVPYFIRSSQSALSYIHNIIRCAKEYITTTK